MTPLGQTYQVNGHPLWVHRSGRGGPTVVFLAGASAFGLDYLNVHKRVAEFTTSVLYDRAGIGFSGPVSLPRSAAEVATELRNLLHAAGIPGPYVLVAHSLGGAYARRFAQLFPADVAAIVALDAFHEDWDDFVPPALRLKATPVPSNFVLRLITWLSRGYYKKLFASWPGEVRSSLIARHLTIDSQRAGALERGDLPAIRDELKSGGAVPDVPVIALTAMAVDPGQRLGLSKSSLAQLHEGKRKIDAALAASVSHGEQRVLEDARHSTIAIDREDAVTQAIHDVWRRTS